MLVYSTQCIRVNGYKYIKYFNIINIIVIINKYNRNKEYFDN
jgi:hypothetical protein